MAEKQRFLKIDYIEHNMLIAAKRYMPAKMAACFSKKMSSIWPSM